MKKHVLLFSAFLVAFAAYSQTMVPTAPQLKNFLIEKGTGHVCGSCPDIAKKCDTVIDSHPGRGMLIEYHFGPDAVPQAALPTDYRTPYGDSILSWPFYLNMMVNRRDQGLPYGSTFIFGTNDNQVKKEADLVVLQSSPVNLAMSSSFNTSTRLLTVNVEAYYTANAATSTNYLQIAITEDSLISTQYDPLNYTQSNGFNPNFNHTNVFRGNINGFSGDPVTTTTSGTLVSRTYTYTLPAKCNHRHCKLTLYATDQKNASGVQSFAGKIMTAIRSDIGGSAISALSEELYTEKICLFPNPSSGMLYVGRELSGDYSMELYGVTGNKLLSMHQLSDNVSKVDLSAFTEGVYFVKITSAKGSSLHKLILAH